MTGPAPGGVHHLAIAVRDLEATAAFYEAVLGLPVLRRWPATDGAAVDRSRWLDLGGGAFLALERSDGQPAAHHDQTPGIQLVALRIAREARADWEARLASAGVPVVHRTAYTIYLRDPEGNRVALSHWPENATEDAAENATQNAPHESPPRRSKEP
jgi:glyoxylase I family protein